jgi:quercetin dioxygenase-like cupin family protein
MSNPTKLHAWLSINREKMSDLVTRQMFHSESMTISRLELKTGAVVPRHNHVNEQISMIVSGVLEFDIDGAKVIVRSGEMLEIPSQVPHSVVAMEDSVAIDIFAPVREDWVRGDDAYLRGR